MSIKRTSSPQQLKQIDQNRSHNYSLHTPASKNYNLDLRRQWEMILKNYTKQKIYSTDTIKLCMEKGISPALRKQLWPKIVGNQQSITEKLFEKFSQMPIDDALLHEIQQDIGRTFKENQSGIDKLFNQGPQTEEMIQLLTSFSRYRPDISYIQGMTYIAGILLVNTSLFNSFVIFCHIVTAQSLIPIFLFDEEKKKTMFYNFHVLLKLQQPEIYKILKKYEISCDIYLNEWFLTLYAKAFDEDIVSRIWDMIFIEGIIIMWRCAISILRLLKNQFHNPEYAIKILKKPSMIKEEDLFKEIVSSQIPYNIMKNLLCYE